MTEQKKNIVKSLPHALFFFYKKIQCVFVDFPFNDFAIYFFLYIDD